MAKMKFLDCFKYNQLTKHTLGASRNLVLQQKKFQIPLTQYVSKPMCTLTQKNQNSSNPPKDAKMVQNCHFFSKWSTTV